MRYFSFVLFTVVVCIATSCKKEEDKKVVDKPAVFEIASPKGPGRTGSLLKMDTKDFVLQYISDSVFLTSTGAFVQNIHYVIDTTGMKTTEVYDPHSQNMPDKNIGAGMVSYINQSGVLAIVSVYSAYHANQNKTEITPNTQNRLGKFSAPLYTLFIQGRCLTNSILATNNSTGNVFMLCGFHTDANGGKEVFISSYGTYLNNWTKFYNPTNGNVEALSILTLCNSSDFLVVASTTDKVTGKKDLLLIRIDNTGKLISHKVFPGTTDYDAYKVVPDPTDCRTFFIIGASPKGFLTKKTAFVMKVDTAGNKLWENNFGTSYESYFTQLTFLKNTNTLLAAGVNMNRGEGSEDVFLQAFSFSGSPLWYTILEDDNYRDFPSDVVANETLYFVPCNRRDKNGNNAPVLIVDKLK